MSCGYEVAEVHHGAVGIPAFGEGDGSNGARGGVDIHPTPSEYHIPINYDPNITRAVSSSGEEARSMVDTETVGEGGS